MLKAYKYRIYPNNNQKKVIDQIIESCRYLYNDFLGTVRTNEFRYVEWIEMETGIQLARELYDHRKDRQENENVIENLEYAEAVGSIAKILRKGWKAAVPNGIVVS